jgi:hypothetical protein
MFPGKWRYIMVTRSTVTLTNWAPVTSQDVDALIGRDVFTRDGEKVGKFKAVFHPVGDFSVGRGRHYFLLDPSLMKDLFGGLDETYIPESAIAGYTDDGVYLSFTEDEIKTRTWTAPADLGTYRRM